MSFRGFLTTNAKLQRILKVFQGKGKIAFWHHGKGIIQKRFSGIIWISGTKIT